MPTAIHADKKCVCDFLKLGADKPFVIPEYQRPYAWGTDEIQTLFDDLWDFAIVSGGSKRRGGSYFLGCIVSFENSDEEQEVIDGQQRITSLFLLLRAIYAKLDGSSTGDEAENFKKQIAPLIWRADPLTGKINQEEILLSSRVINSDGNQILREILASGKTKDEAKDNYSQNYVTLQKLFSEHCEKEPLMVYDFIYALLNQAIVLPISADTQDTALTIFSTLNDRGLPLSDADIFKAKIYSSLKPEEKAAFVEDWQELSDEAERAHENIQKLFYYYMFYLRALAADRDTTIPGVRKYYSSNKFEKLYKPELMHDLHKIADLLKVINARIKTEPEEAWQDDIKILQLLDTLNFYPNEFGKYPIIVYYLIHRDNPGFTNNFRTFLKKLTRELVVRYVLSPSVTAVKADILNLNAEIVKSMKPQFGFRNQDETQLNELLHTPHYKTVRMLLCVLAYEKQDDLLPIMPIWEIEHILPQKWQKTYFPNANDETIREKIENLGNKIPFEKRLNIIAGNGYFDKKRKEYSSSRIKMAKEMSTFSKHEWGLDEIAERNIRVSDELLRIFNSWTVEYANDNPESSAQPSPEESALITLFKQKGWI